MTFREFLDWLTTSRHTRSLEAQLVTQRQDFLTRLAEKDTIIQELSARLSAERLECDRMRMVLMPLSSGAGAMYAARFAGVKQEKPPTAKAPNGTLDWPGELERLLKMETQAEHGTDETAKANQ